MRTEATHVICCPGSPNDGKRVRLLSEYGYNPRTDTYERGWVDVEMVDTGVIGNIERRFLAEVQ
ncbi:TPA: hypothetical protein QDB14_000980 [Burkholderia vietnamiensis]|uniref:hypothetical protein n=1 Tax=Burkholderia vietnamiensis TaxID=60552 RepID=UPI001593596A|nr:hypothetical protein [Burkholderia vietnamiensis]HDR9026813.1 hypothetical protein [Burkholderia vietnamiensis]